MKIKFNPALECMADTNNDNGYHYRVITVCKVVDKHFTWVSSLKGILKHMNTSDSSCKELKWAWLWLERRCLQVLRNFFAWSALESNFNDYFFRRNISEKWKSLCWNDSIFVATQGLFPKVIFSAGALLMWWIIGCRLKVFNIFWSVSKACKS